MTYAIEFRFPEGVVYAGDHKGACGFAPSLRTASMFSDPDAAARLLRSGYGPSVSQYGFVVSVATTAA